MNGSRLKSWPTQAKRATNRPATTISTSSSLHRSRRTRKAVVFVHGIFSSHETFLVARDHIARDSRLSGVEFYYFDYRYLQEIGENGLELANALIEAGFQTGDEVAIVAHSMGGLVSRLAILTKPLEFVRILFLLGTPGAGALRVKQLSALLQLLHIAGNKFFANFPRLAGIVNLSNVAKDIDSRRSNWANAVNIDYISIPGLYFHQDRNIWEHPDNTVNLGFTALEHALFRLLTVRLERPHDGIVEESSVNLIECPRPTEKIDSYGALRGDQSATYAHIKLAACNDINHVQIHLNSDVLSIICDLISWKFGTPSPPHSNSIDNWIYSLGRHYRLRYGLQSQLDR